MHPCVANLQISLGATVLASAMTGRCLSSEIDNTSKGNVCRPQQQQHDKPDKQLVPLQLVHIQTQK